MFQNSLFKLVISLALITILTLGARIPVIGEIHAAYAAADRLTSPKTSYSSVTPINSSTEWLQVDKYVIDAIRIAHDSAEEFATYELDIWVDDLMRKVDDKFLSWYFNYFNQKAMEFGIPFAWLAFNIDLLNLLKKEGETHLNANEILEKRMMEDLQTKFSQLVLTPEEAQQSLVKQTEIVAHTNASS